YDHGSFDRQLPPGTGAGGREERTSRSMTLKKPIKVLLGPSSFAEQDEGPLRKLAQNDCRVVPNPFKRKLTKQELVDLLKEDVDGIIAGLEPLDRDVLESSRLKVISRCGSGLSNVDMDSAKRLGIKVFSTPSGPTQAVAELTVGALLALL